MEQKSPFSSMTSFRESGDREFVFTNADFERVRKLIYEHAGISLSPAKQDMVYSRLARRLRETRLKSFGDYLAIKCLCESYHTNHNGKIVRVFKHAAHKTLINLDYGGRQAFEIRE